MTEKQNYPSSRPEEYETHNARPLILGLGAVGIGVISGELLVLSQVDSDHSYAETAEVAGIAGLGLAAVMSATAVVTKLVNNRKK